MKNEQSEIDQPEFVQEDYVNFIETPHTEVLVEFSWFRCILKYVICTVIAVLAISIFVSVAFFIHQVYKEEGNVNPPTSSTNQAPTPPPTVNKQPELTPAPVVEDHSTRLLTGHKRLVNALAFSPDNRLILSGEGNTHYSSSGDDTNGDKETNSYQNYSETYPLYVWKYESGRPERMLNEHKHPVTAVAFSPDGTMAASADNGGTFVIWNTSTWQIMEKYIPEKRFQQRMEKPLNYKCLAFSPNNKFLAVGGSVLPAKQKDSEAKNDTNRKAVVVIWDIIQHKEVVDVQPLSVPQPQFQFSRQCDCVFSLKYIASGKTLVAGVSGADSGIYLLDRTGEIMKMVDVNQNRPAMDESVTQRSSGHDSPASLFINAALRFDDHRIVAGDNLGRMSLWDYQAELPGISRIEALDMIKQSNRVDQNIHNIQYSNDGKYFITCGDEICVWNGLSEKLELIGYLSPEAEAIYQSVPYYGLCIAFTPNNESVAIGCSDKTIRIWDFKSFSSSLRKATTLNIESKIKAHATEKIEEPMELNFRDHKN